MSNTRITGNAQEGYVVHGEWGSVEMKCLDVHIGLHYVQSVGLENLCDVQSHTINRIANSTSHVVRFFGGGHVQFAYNDRGQLLESSGQSVNFRLDENSKRLYFSPCRPSPSANPTGARTP